MPATKMGGYLTMKVSHLNARLFNRLLSQNGKALYGAEQGKILAALWMKRPQSASELAAMTGLANSSLTLMLKRLEHEQGLVCSFASPDDKRKRLIDLTELGLSQQEVGEDVSEKLATRFYDGFDEDEIAAFELYMQRILENLDHALKDDKKVQK